MLTCFRCKLEINDPQKLFEHIKKFHKICGNHCEVQCTLCGMCYTDFSTFKKHVVVCFARTPENYSIPLDMYEYAIDEEVCKFEASIQQFALELVCDLGSNMRAPRREVFNTIDKFKNLIISGVISGINECISPHIPPVKQEIVDQFNATLESLFDKINTEEKLHSVLYDLDLMAPLEKCEVLKIENKNKGKLPRKRRKPIEGSNNAIVDGVLRRKRIIEAVDSDESDYLDDDEQIEETDGSEVESGKPEDEITRGTVVVMPIEFQMRKFLELPQVFEKIRMNIAMMKEKTDIHHFVQCELWKEKLKNYKPDQIVIPFHFYGDGVQLNNPIGPRAKSGEQQMCYFSFPGTPHKFQSRIENIFVAQLYSATLHKIFTTEELYNNIIGTFTRLAEDGIRIKVDGEEFTVFLVCGLFLGDNKEQNQRLGFVGSFVGIHCCRYCNMDLDNIRTEVNCQRATLRNRDNYDADVLLNNVTQTGVKEYSPFNLIPLFHVTESSGVDLAHDLTEGVLHRSLSNSITYFIRHKYFDLDYLNMRISNMDFGEAEKGNRPTTITMAHLKAQKFKMTSSEMFFFMHHFTLMVGDRVPRSDPVWKHILVTLQFFDISYSPSYNDDQMNSILVTSEDMNQGLKDLFGLSLQHKSHLGTHYTGLTKKFGPLRHLQTLRFESKHKEVKSYAKNINSRLNLSLSIAIKTQYKFALRLLKQEALDDRISVPHYTKGKIEKKVYFKRLTPSIHLTGFLRGELFFTKKATVNGIIFSLELWLPSFEDDENKKINQIVDIVILDLNEVKGIFAICKRYSTVTFDVHYGSYAVDMNSLEKELSIISVHEFLSNHYYPVKIHNNEEKCLFRCKRF